MIGQLAADVVLYYSLFCFGDFSCVAGVVLLVKYLFEDCSLCVSMFFVRQPLFLQREESQAFLFVLHDIYIYLVYMIKKKTDSHAQRPRPPRLYVNVCVFMFTCMYHMRIEYTAVVYGCVCRSVS